MNLNHDSYSPLFQARAAHGYTLPSRYDVSLPGDCRLEFWYFFPDMGIFDMVRTCRSVRKLGSSRFNEVAGKMTVSSIQLQRYFVFLGLILFTIGLWLSDLGFNKIYAAPFVGAGLGFMIGGLTMIGLIKRLESI
jgi:hypothetical protein